MAALIRMWKDKVLAYILPKKIDAADGNIIVTSEPDMGSKFIIYFKA